MKQSTFVQRIMAIVKGGDEAKLVRFESKLSKYFDKQVKMREEAIEDVREQILDAQEALRDAVDSVDMDQLATKESSDAYCVSYINSVAKANERIEELNFQIKDLQEEIKQLQDTKSIIFN